ncbi:MAG: hypothetical protein HLUCCA11_15905 [Phormidesmis priestleyi Ana]|uniref:Uncharacterized protein n=1 Tax=Phormidesmis priestleyi Ana TaxID=1666911 RepID=A0A0P7YUG1_9CYAN|nr:MAG: hypothetical protein HLUCCA11_15905 [Phormidesmis priestleyi Ana]
MKNSVFASVFVTVKSFAQAIAQNLAHWFVVCLVGVVMMWSLLPPAALAATNNTVPVGEPTTSLSAERLEQKRAERRELQSRASEAADTEKEAAGSIGEVLTKKLNLDEIAEENVLIDEAQDILNLDADRK